MELFYVVSRENGRKFTVVENHRKSLIQHCERSEKCLQFESTKVHQKCQKWSILAIYRKPENATFLVIFKHCAHLSLAFLETNKDDQNDLSISIKRKTFGNSDMSFIIRRRVMIGLRAIFFFSFFQKVISV